MSTRKNLKARGTVPSILVIDDEVAFADYLCRGLSYEGYKVTAAQNAEEGWDLILLSNPDLVILDVGLPDVDGISLCRSLRLERHQMPIFNAYRTYQCI